MRNYYKKIIETLHQWYPRMMLGLNLVALLLGLFYLMIGKVNVFWNFSGFLMLGALLGTIWMIVVEDVNKRLSCLYLFLSALWMLLIGLINTAVSLNPQNQKSQSTISAVMLFSLFFLGGLIAANKKTSNDLVRSKTSIVLNNLIIIALSAVLYSGLFLAINLLREQKNGILEVFISEYALFLAIAFLSLGVLIIKLLNKKKYYLYYSIVLTFTIFMFVVCLLPFASVPSLIHNSKEYYTAAFGEDYKNTAYQKEHFRQLPFSLLEYLLGTPSKGYQVQENILFYQGTKGIDKGLELYFDVYTPATDGSKLPGANSILIRVHGGGWTSGDKGAANFAQMNKYFASQGYVVFDIQYGLNDVMSWLNFIPMSKNKLGDFSIDDMVRHIGIFTDYLVEHGDEYPANLDSVFLSGGSAGGQLVLAFGLGLASGSYQDILNPHITIKGLIPFYPANGLSVVFDINGEDALVYPNLLVDKNSPPCLIYQGSHDGLVSHEIADEFRNTYLKNGNSKCAVIEMPFGGHGSDLYFAGYYNQVFLYYMERFLYQYR